MNDLWMEGKTGDFNTIQGSIELIDCTGTQVSSVTGRISLSECNYDKISSVVGEITIHNSTIQEIMNIVGDISCCNSNIKSIINQTGETTILNSIVDEVTTMELGRVDGSEIKKIKINTNSKAIYSGILDSIEDKNTIYLPTTSRIHEIIFEYPGKVYSPYEIKTNGTLILN